MTEIPIQFVANDIIIGNNFAQVEFSDDGRSMTWVEPSGTIQKVYYADVNLETGLPDLVNKQFIDNIQGQGWPYWGKYSQGSFFLILNTSKEFILVRKTGFNTLIKTNLGTINSDIKTLINVSYNPSKPYFWVSYVVKSTTIGGKDKLYCFRSDNLTTRIFVNEEIPNNAGSAYELTFPRWVKNSEKLLYPFRGNSSIPKFDIKLWDSSTQTSTQITNDGNSFHHVDDLAFTINDQNYLFSSKDASILTICKQQTNGLYTEIESYSTPSTILPYTLTSFEPFTINGKTFGAYQVYEGGGIPGNTKGEIWLKGILGESLQIKISTLNGVTLDPEYLIGNSKVWIYYYGKPIGQSAFDLHRCETPLGL
ncbi:MAG: hypothetical protein SFU91_04900 [Chloroherpetonaceae bacterium]|nr:hypothetical protein [Chloroherpetonaceae bacterium]